MEIVRMDRICSKMYVMCFFIVTFLGFVWCSPQMFETKFYKVGIEYDNSLPMSGGSDRYRHRNNYDPFFVTVTATAKKGFVITYLEVSATVDEGGDVAFHVINGNTGSRTMVFQLVSNHSDFLKYSYLAYGISEEKYKKISNIIEVPIPGNYGAKMRLNISTFVIVIVISLFVI